MKKISTPPISQVSCETPWREDVAPRRKTLDFIRNFARSCRSVNLSDSRSELSVIVLN